MFGWWRTFKDTGALPWPGDFLDQPAFVSEAITLCDRTFAPLQAKLEADAFRGVTRGA